MNARHNARMIELADYAELLNETQTTEVDTYGLTEHDSWEDCWTDLDAATSSNDWNDRDLIADDMLEIMPECAREAYEADYLDC